MKQFRKVASHLRSIKASKSLRLDFSFYTLDRKVRSFSVKCFQFCKTRFSQDVSDRIGNSADELSQAILQTENLASLTTTKIAGLAGGSLSTSLGFGVASLFGTAGTGAAISSLSGAAATSASLAWLGGSVASGGLLLLVTGLAAGVGSAQLARKFVVDKLINKSRRATHLTSRECKCIEALAVLSDYIRNRNSLSELSAFELSIMRKSIRVLQSDLASVVSNYGDWPRLSKQRVYKALAHFNGAISKVFDAVNDQKIDIAIGSFSACLVALLSNPASIPHPESDEYLIIEAVRLSKGTLNQASDEQIISYVCDLNDSQMEGLLSSIKGKYFELLFAKEESSDGDNITARLFESLNHEASDIQLIDTETGEVLEEIQLKATDYLSYIREHQRKYEDVPIYATSEIASKDDSIMDSGIANETLTRDVENVFDAIRGGQHAPLNDLLDSVAISMTVGCAVELKRIADGAPVDQRFRQSLIRQGAAAALVSTVLSAT